MYIISTKQTPLTHFAIRLTTYYKLHTGPTVKCGARVLVRRSHFCIWKKHTSTIIKVRLKH